MRSLAWLLIGVGGCGSPMTASTSDLDTSDLQTGASDLSQCVAGEVCTSTSCAAAPCTAGCIFEAKSAAGCSTAFPSTVSTAAVKQCAGFCALGLDGYFPCMQWYSTNGHCYHFDPHAHAGCDQYMCLVDDSCLINDITFDENQAAICPANDACDDGVPPSDGAVPCFDLSQLEDMATPVDAATD